MLDRENDKRIYNLGFCGDNDNQDDYIDMLLGAIDSCDENSDEYKNAIEELDEYYPHRYYVRGDNYSGWIAYDLYALHCTIDLEDEPEAEDYIKEFYMD